MNAAFLLAQTVWRLFLLLVGLTLVGLLTVRHPSVVVPVELVAVVIVVLVVRWWREYEKEISTRLR